MKYKLFFFFVLTFFVVSNVSGIQNPEEQNTSADMRFVGTWKGSSYNEKQGYIKTWVQVRDRQGNYTIHFKVFSPENEFLGELKEKGKWWVKNNLFYEFNPNAMKEPDVYRFEFLINNELQFTMLKHDISGEINGDYIEGYTFKETKAQ